MTTGDMLTERDGAAEPEAAGPVDPSSVHIAPSQLGTVLDQLREAQSQLAAVNRMMASGGDCVDIVTQMAAAAETLDRVGFGIISAGLKQCMTEKSATEGVDTASLQKLFLSLA
jgi:DNA-binding FrmR family transcriptional regulator